MIPKSYHPIRILYTINIRHTIGSFVTTVLIRLQPIPNFRPLLNIVSLTGKNVTIRFNLLRPPPDDSDYKCHNHRIDSQ